MPLGDYIPVKNHPDLVREMNSHAVINKNSNALLSAKKQKEYILNMRCKQIELEHEVNSLKEIVNSLKAMMAFNKT